MAGRAGALAATAQTMSEPPATGRQLDLDERLDRLGVVVEAIWELLEEKGYSAEELETKVMDLGQQLIATPMMSATPCRRCEALVPRGMDHCQFCGEPTGNSSPFSGLTT